ncbi:nicolin-1 isoform X2 [Microcaecilia unicolor]|nr:nicolin-1 isoform X2 [Microcaecilia unicolor]XP_030063367.1 nicolin-1 isoform X2 [Microcaecilia unicolor]XP_030063368.1 nicolin-1 isoform X2 [Microcaecilia unicolor]
MSRDPVLCTIKGPIMLQVGDVKTDFARAGVAVIDVTFPQTKAVDVQEIVFKNYYTAFLSIRILQNNHHCSGERSRNWRTCLRNYCLMPNPHTEDGSQEYTSLFRQQMLCDLDQVTSLRLILRQPSPVWLHFSLEELQIYHCGQENPQKGFPLWLSCLLSQEQPTKVHNALPDAEKASSEVQQMWMLTEVIQTNETAARIGRFDVDGCYDINLLSYT